MEQTDNTPKAATAHRTPVSERLDRLYGRNVRCPYCATLIPKFVSTCPNCGISKAQLAEAIVKGEKKKKGEKKDKIGQKRIWSKVRPADIPFWKMAVGCLFGFLGIHCFVSRRWIRGLVILGSVLMFILFSIIIFTPELPLESGETIEAHAARVAFTAQGLMFPTDPLIMVGLGLWVYDWITVLFGTYKYPVIIKADEPNERPK